MSSNYAKWSGLGGGGGGGSTSIAIGETVTGGTAGSILFVDSSGDLGQDNSHLFWDTVNARLGVGTKSPNRNLCINDASGNTYLSFMNNGSSVSLFGTDSGNPFIYFNIVLSQYGLIQNSSGQWSMGRIAPTPSAWLTLQAGTATAGQAPLKLTTGVNLTTAEVGAIEFDGTNLYYTDSGPTRQTLVTKNYLGVLDQNLVPAVSDTDSVGTTSKRFTTAFLTNRCEVGSNLELVARANSTSPTGATVSGIDTESADRDIAVFSANNSTNNSTATFNVRLETGNKSAGTGNSGNIILQTGTSAGGSRGTVNLNSPAVLKSTAQTIAAAGTISSSTSVNALQAASAVATSTSTVIASGLADGQILTVVNVGSNTITLKAGGNTALPSLTDYALAASGSISFVWIGSTWYTTGLSVN